MAIRYQPSIDGLRALAVVPVILFHAGFSAWSGGFVGVDVFYVISGYLITQIVAGDIAAKRFSIVTFYERRIRRIFPALMLVIFCSLLVGLAIFLPYQLTDLAWSAVNAVTFTSNIWFWRNTGYFEGSGTLYPLLHTWSLAVEEQFYLFFPPALWLVSRLRIPLLAFVLTVLILSLVLSGAMVRIAPSAAFYLLPTRAWELMLGAVLALERLPPLRSRTWREVAAAAGIAMIIAPVFLYDSQTPFPGLAAVPPCLGTAMLIFAGKEGGCRVTDAMGNRVLVGIGLISYSLYLWHWPIFVFSRQWLLVEHLPVGVAWAGIALAFALAFLSWRYVEAPFRDRRRSSRKGIFIAGFAMAALAGGFALALVGGVPGRFDAEGRRLADARKDVPPTIGACIAADVTSSCRIGANAPVSFAVWGDSHSAALGGAVDQVARNRNQGGRIYAFNGCPPAIGATAPTLNSAGQRSCGERNQAVETALVADPAFRTVVLIANWQAYLDRNPEGLLTPLDRTLERLRNAGKRVVLLANLPAPGFDAPWVAAMSHYYARPRPESRLATPIDSRLSKIAQRNGAEIVNMSVPFCTTGRCPIDRDGRLLFIDANHVSNSANQALVAPYLSRSNIFRESRWNEPGASVEQSGKLHR